MAENKKLNEKEVEKVAGGTQVVSAECTCRGCGKTFRRVNNMRNPMKEAIMMNDPLREQQLLHDILKDSYCDECMENPDVKKTLPKEPELKIPLDHRIMTVRKTNFEGE